MMGDFARRQQEVGEVDGPALQEQGQLLDTSVELGFIVTRARARQAPQDLEAFRKPQ
jgi:hypothetical protein